MSKIACIIVDDEPLARKGLEEYIQGIDFLSLKASCENPVVANKILHKEHIDLMFLDIQMPYLSGLEFLKTLKHPPVVILTTAYPEYALDSFDLDVIDYLLKPISMSRFLKACNKAREFIELKKPGALSAGNRPDYFFVKVDYQFKKIRFDEVLYIEAMQNYVQIHVPQKTYITYLTLQHMEDFLPADHFIKVHKSFIVSMSKIDSIEGHVVTIGSAQIPISRIKHDEILETILKNKLLKRE